VGPQVVFAHEAPPRPPVAVPGTSGHAVRNHPPVLPLLPVEYAARWPPTVPGPAPAPTSSGPAEPLPR
jgi:hypothetical protein